MPEQALPNKRSVFTIGHSNHDEQTFVELLKQHRIDVVADVRSQPYAKYATHFNADQIQPALADSGIDYVFLGQQVGGRPDNPQFYDAEGYVLYDRLAQSPSFLEGIQRLEKGIQKYRVALLCSEEDPVECHRNLLVGRVLIGRGTEVWHIRGDGRLQSQAELQRESCKGDPRQQFLFEELKEPPWRSIRSVSPKPRQPNSSES
jgi:uncharacterized protein (DUF488 family)